MGATSLFIAGKFEEIDMISMKFIVNAVGHRHFNARQVFNLEREVLTRLEWIIPHNSL